MRPGIDRITFKTVLILVMLAGFGAGCAGGKSSIQQKQEPQPVRPRIPAGYVNNNNGTVSDRANGLMWVAQVPAWPMQFAQARQWASSLRIGGHNDWRLPNVKEMGTHIDNHGGLTSAQERRGLYGMTEYRRPWIPEWLTEFGFVLPKVQMAVVNYWTTDMDSSASSFMGGPCNYVVTLVEGIHGLSSMRSDAARNYAWAVRTIREATRTNSSM